MDSPLSVLSNLNLIQKRVCKMTEITLCRAACEQDYEFPDGGVDEAVNYCRNPDPLQRTEGPWCYTNSGDTTWDYCNVPFCGRFVGTTRITCLMRKTGLSGLLLSVK